MRQRDPEVSTSTSKPKQQKKQDQVVGSLTEERGALTETDKEVINGFKKAKNSRDVVLLLRDTINIEEDEYGDWARLKKSKPQCLTKLSKLAKNCAGGKQMKYGG